MNDPGIELQKHAADTWQVIRNRIGLITLSFLLVFLVSAIVTYIMPRKYRGKVEMKIERNVNKLPVFNRELADQPYTLGENMIRTEFESITKLETLYPVIEAYDLVKRWGVPTRQDAANKLRKNLDTQSNVRSDFVVIEYYDEDPKYAADIANAIAESYKKKRVDIESEQKNEALKIIQRQIADLEQRSNEARLKMQAARQKAGIIGEGLYNPGQVNTPGATVQTPTEAIAITREQELLKANLEIQSLQADLSELGKLQGDELVARASGLKIDSPVFATQYAEYQKLVVDREGYLKQGLGPRHPTVAAIDERLRVSKQIAIKEALDYRMGLESRVASAIQRKTQLEDYNNASKKDVFDQQSAQSLYLVAKRDVENIDTSLIQLRLRYSEAELGQAQAKAAATVFEKAEPERTPAKPNMVLNLALGAVLGLMFGFGLAFFLEYMDTTVKSLDDVERYLGVPVLAVVPKDVGILHRASGFNPDAEAYRILRTNIEFNRRNPNANCITVVSGGAGEGKSTTLSNLAFVCAQGGYNVLLIDADLRRPRLHTLFDMSNAVGLTNYLTTEVRLEEVVVQTPVENLYFLPSGILPADSAGILNSQRMSEMIEEVKSRFDLVLIDSPPILGVSDASVLANEADMTIIVVQHRKLPRHMLMRVKQAVENVGGKVLGVVLNNVDVRSDNQYSYYTSYYTYYSPSNVGASHSHHNKQRKKDRNDGQFTRPRAGGNVSKVTAAPPRGPQDDLF